MGGTGFYGYSVHGIGPGVAPARVELRFQPQSSPPAAPLLWRGRVASLRLGDTKRALRLGARSLSLPSTSLEATESSFCMRPSGSATEVSTLRPALLQLAADP